MIFSALIRPIIGCKADIVLIFIVFIFVSYSLGIADRNGLSFFSIVLSNPLINNTSSKLLIALFAARYPGFKLR